MTYHLLSCSGRWCQQNELFSKGLNFLLSACEFQLASLHSQPLWSVEGEKQRGGGGRRRRGRREWGERQWYLPHVQFNEIHYISRFPSPVMGMFDMYICH